MNPWNVIIVFLIGLLGSLILSEILLREKIDYVQIPREVSLDTTKYRILSMDSMTVNGVKIRGFWYMKRGGK